MTKSNKTLLCCLLACVMVLACALTLLPIAEPITANAATGEYTLVTSESDLKAGDKIIIVEADNAKAAAAMGTGKYLTAVECTFSSENTVQSADAIEITLGGESGAWTLTTSEGVIGTTVAKTMAIGKGTTTWSISIAENGSATIASTNSSFGKILYNVNSPRFLNYTSSPAKDMLLPRIYKEATSEPACEHDYGNEIAQVNATCTVDGMKAHYECSKCNKLFVLDGETYKEVSEADLVIKAAHTWSDTYTITTAATCQANAKGTYTCSVCQATEELEIADTKLDHDYSGASGTCVNGCGYTKDENLVLEAYALDVSASLGKQTLTGVVKSVTSSKVTIEVGSLSDNLIICYQMTNGSSLSVGDKITVTGELFRYSATEVEFNSGATYQLITESLVINETLAAGTGTTESNGKLYIKKGSQVVVTYSVDTNTGINGLGGTFNYNKNFFAINNLATDIVVTNIFGATVEITGTETTADAVKFLFVERTDNTSFDGTATGSFISVTYTVIADITADDLANVTFGLTDVQAVKDGNTALTETELVVNNLSDYNFAVSNTTTITVDGKETGATIERTYDGTTFSVGTEDSDTYKLASNRIDEPTITWTLGGETVTELKNAGTYTLTIEYAATAEYEAATATYTIVVKQVVLEKEMTEIVIKEDHVRKPLDKGSVSWNENDFEITVIGLVEGEEIADVATITFEPTTLTKPETVSMTVTLKLNGNYVYDDNSDTFTYTTDVTAYATPLKFSGLVTSGTYYYGQLFDFTQMKVVNENDEEVEVTIKITVAKNKDSDVELTTDELKKNFVKNAGNYTIMIVATPASADYEELNTIVEYTILPRTLSDIKLVYTTDGEVSWANATTYYTDNAEQATELTDELVLTYTVGETPLTENKFAPQAKGTFKIVVTTNSENYIANSVDTLEVFAVTFVDEKHENVVQYRFEGQLATSFDPATVGGFEFVGWYVTVDETESKYDFTAKVTADVTITAKWNALTFTVTLMDGETKLQTIGDIEYEKLLSELGILTPSKDDDEDYYYTFVGWTLTADGEVIDLAATKVTADMTLYAKFTSANNKFTLTWTLTFNGKQVENGTLTVKRNTLLAEIAGLPTSKYENILAIGTWTADGKEFTAMPTSDVEITAKYEIVLKAGDVNGDGKVNLDDVVLFRQYLVGGYAMDVVAPEDIYTAITAQGAASKTMFFLFAADMDNDSKLDIRDVATVRMNVVEMPAESGDDQTQTTASATLVETATEAVQYAVLPTKFNVYA